MGIAAPAAGRLCRTDGCERAARRESPWCDDHFLDILVSVYRTVRLHEVGPLRGEQHDSGRPPGRDVLLSPPAA